MRKNFQAMNPTDPSLRDLLETLLVWGIYPLWLLAGAGDYLCHRQTDIEHTSGSEESWFHIAQFLALLGAFAAVVLLQMNAVVFGGVVLLVLAHSVIAHLDVAHTDGRRYISPLEQQIHGFMEVLPLVAVAIVGVLHWQEIGELSTPLLSLSPSLGIDSIGLLASFILLAGAPILEEMMRSRRHRMEREARYQTGLATIR